MGRHNTAFRFLIKNVTADRPTAAKLNETIAYHWIEIGLWTSWKPSHRSALICIVRDESGTDHFWPRLEQNLSQTNEIPKANLEQPFLWHQFIMPYISEAFYSSVWSCRDRIRYLEENRPSTVPATRPHYQTMHEVARHAIHITEVLTMSITVVNEMIEAVRNFRDPANRQSKRSYDHERALDTLMCQKTLLQCSHGRSEALNSRLQNEINLVGLDFAEM